ncbi:MAG: GNAT family N-acetyltransferase [Anaerolineae bacterium]|nr:GNAT family N-acetyltransferase [Anaerolineae bacterium]
MTQIDIRPVYDIEEMQQIEAVQRQVWRNDERMIIHTHWMVSLAHSGGLVLGAFDGDKVVGFLMGFLGTEETFDGRPAMAALKHWSKRMGVLPEYQGHGLGLQLKLAQRDIIIRQGIELISWSFDPLRSRNAHINLHRLGAVTRRYLRDYYGALDDDQNAGLPTDRMIADWWVRSRRVKERVESGRGALALEHYASAGVPIINPTQIAPDDGLPWPGESAVKVDNLIVFVEIPTDFDTILHHDMELAKAWREHAREVFESVFAEGFVATDFIHAEMEGRPRGLYVLSLLGERE